MSQEGRIEALDYRELQARCKALGVNAKGKRDELELRLVEAISLAETPSRAGTHESGGARRTRAAAAAAAPSSSVASARRVRQLKEEEAPPATPEHSRSRRLTRGQLKREELGLDREAEEGEAPAGDSGDGGEETTIASPARELVQEAQELADHAYKVAKAGTLQRVRQAAGWLRANRWGVAARLAPFLAFLVAFLIALTIQAHRAGRPGPLSSSYSILQERSHSLGDQLLAGVGHARTSLTFVGGRLSDAGASLAQRFPSLARKARETIDAIPTAEETFKPLVSG